MAFCVAVVTLFSKIFGADNSVPGVVVLLAVLVLRQADFGVRTSHGLLCIAGIFGILIAGPRITNMMHPVPAFFVNVACILILMIFGCHNVIMSNQSTFVLGYLLLQGYDVSGHAYVLRVTSHGLLCIAGIFGILIAGPRITNMMHPVPAFFVNVACILILMIFGCHNVIMSNQSTFVLGYLLLQGYDVSGHAYVLRVISLLIGMGICMAVFYKNQKNRPYRRTFLDLFREFDVRSARNWWYIKLTLIVSSALLIVSLLGWPRAMWAGIACMSVCLPFHEDSVERAKRRGPFNIVGCMIFLILYHVLPESMYPYIGMIGGIGVGYSAGYAWQTVFNTFGALSIASGLFGAGTAVTLRIIFNVMGSVYTVVCDRFLDFLRKRTEIHRVGEMA